MRPARRQRRHLGLATGLSRSAPGRLSRSGRAPPGTGGAEAGGKRPLHGRDATRGRLGHETRVMVPVRGEPFGVAQGDETFRRILGQDADVDFLGMKALGCGAGCLTGGTGPDGDGTSRCTAGDDGERIRIIRRFIGPID